MEANLFLIENIIAACDFKIHRPRENQIKVREWGCDTKYLKFEYLDDKHEVMYTEIKEKL